MKLKIRIDEIDFCDVILKAIPVLQAKAPNDGSAISKIITVVAQLPHESIRTILETVSKEDQCEIVALLVQDNREQLTKVLSQLLKQNGIDVSLDDLSLSKELELNITVGNLNYAALAAKYLPLVQDSFLLDKNSPVGIFTTLLKLPGMLLFGALDKIPQNKKAEAIAYLINRNKEQLIKKLEKLIANQDIHIRLGDLNIDV